MSSRPLACSWRPFVAVAIVCALAAQPAVANESEPPDFAIEGVRSGDAPARDEAADNSAVTGAVRPGGALVQDEAAGSSPVTGGVRLGGALVQDEAAGSSAVSGGVRLGEVEVRGQAPDVPRAADAADPDPTAFGTTIRAQDFAGERPGAVDLLLQAPGTRIRRAPGGSTLSLRGSSPEQTLVLLDGIRLNSVAGGGVDLRGLPAGLVDRVTVVRGNLGARYGAGALGGVALVSTRAARPGDTEGALSLTGGSFGTYGLDASISGGSDRFQGLAALSLDTSRGDFPVRYDPTPSSDPSDVRIEKLANNDSHGGGLLLKGAGRFGGVRLHAMTQGAMGERGLPGTLYWRDTLRREERRLLAAVRAEPAERGDHSIQGGLDFRRDEVAIRDGTITGVSAQPAGDGGVWQIENAVDAVAVIESAPVGWTFLRVEGRAGGEWLTSPFHSDRSRERLSATLLDELYAGDAVTIAPGVRFERIGDFQGVSPALGISYRPFDGVELRANAGKTFRAPTFGELFLEQGLLKPNPDLLPERGTSLDAGAAWRSRRTALQVSAFHARTSDMIVYEVVSNGITKPFNFLDAEIVGGEAEGSIEPLRRLLLTASYGVARTRNLRDDPRFFGKELPYRPTWRALARIAWRGPDTEAFVEGSRQSAQFVNRSNTAELPAQTALRGGAGARLWRSDYDVWLSGRVENAFDAELVDQLGFPQPGRAFFLTLRVVPFGRSRPESET